MRSLVRVLLSLAVAAGLVLLLLELTGTSVQEVWGTLRGMDRSVYLAALGVQALIYPVRTLRFAALLPAARRPPLQRLLPVTAAHILAANVLPAKVGEAALVIYLRKYAGVPGAHGLALLLVSRVLDFATVAGGLAVACLALGLAGTYPDLEWLVPMGAALVLPTVLFFWLAANGDRLVALATWGLRVTRLERTVLGAKVRSLADKLRDALTEVERGQLLRGALLTIPVWLLVFGFYAVLARGLGMGELAFPAAVFGASLSILSTLLPVNGFAGFGVQDAGWVAGFMAIGISAEVATSSGLAAHCVYLGNLCVFGLLGHVAMSAQGPVVTSSDEE